MQNRLVLVVAALALSQLVSAAAAGEPFQVAREGKATVPIVVSEKANASVRQSAEQLRDMLGRMTGATFVIEEGNGKAGIAVGMLGDFSGLEADQRLAKATPPAGADPTHRLIAFQSYALRSHAGGVEVVGGSELGVEYAVWDLLHRAGFRHFFPGAAWEVVPRVPNLELDVDAMEKPDYYDRRISCMGGKETWEWLVRNRVNLHSAWAGQESFRPAMSARWKNNIIETSHAYSYIVRDHPEVFKAHPEWMALSKGERGLSTFLCISQPGLRDFVAKYAIDYLKKYPEQFSVSMEPTDGDGWCECPECAKFGKVSNRPVTLANRVAEEIEKEFPAEQIKLVGMLGYGFHWQPPDIDVHDRVVVMLTTKTLCPGLNPDPPMEERMAGWAKRAKHLGVYDYWSVFGWGGWTPGHAAAGNPKYLADVIPRYHGLGARCWLSEADESWGSTGHGYYLASRLFWSVEEAQNAEAIFDDFLDRAFGAAKEPVRAYYAAVDGRHGASPGNPNAIRGRLTEMYPALLRARELAKEDKAVLKRVDQLLLYTRLAELLAEHYVAKGKFDLKLDGVSEEDVRESVKSFMRLCYQIRDTHMVNYTFLDQTWMRPAGLTLKDLAPAGAEAPPELADADVDAIAADAARRYTGAAAERKAEGAPFAARNGERVLFDAGGFEAATEVAAMSREAQQDDAAAVDADPAESPQARWAVEELRPQDVQVTSTPAGADDPGPADGRFYCRLKRESGETHLRAPLETQDKGVVEVQWMAHGDPRGDGDNAIGFGLSEGSTYRIAVMTRITGDVVYMTADEAYQDTGLDYDGQKWQKWRIRYTPGADTFSLTVGDKTVDNLPVARKGNVDRFEARVAQSATKFYLDGLAGAAAAAVSN